MYLYKDSEVWLMPFKANGNFRIIRLSVVLEDESHVVLRNKTEDLRLFTQNC